MTNDALIQEQLRREEQHRVEAVALSTNRLIEAMDNNDIDSLPAARVLIKHTLIPLREQLAKMLRDKKRRSPDLLWYARIGVDAAAILLLRTLCKNTLARHGKEASPVTLQRLCVPLGRSIMWEAHVLDAREVNPVYMGRAEEFLRARNITAENHTRRTMLAAADVVMHGEDFQPAADEALQVGKWAVQAGLDVGIIERDTARDKRGHTLPVFRLESSLEELLTNTGIMDSILGAAKLMVAPPRPWAPGVAGGYLSGRSNRMAAKNHKGDRIAAREGLNESPALLSALNYLQSIPLELDQRGISIVRAVWADSSGGSLGLPSIHATAEPAFPLPKGWDKGTADPESLEKFQAWCHVKADWYTAEKKRKTSVKGVSNILREGVALAGRAVYAPTFPDWRTRIYYQGSPNPQGEDFQKASIQFHEKRPLGADGLEWLKVHVANCLGYDKTRLKDRAAWTTKNLQDLASGMLKPHNHELYLECTDYPVMAAVAVQELVEALDSARPEDYMSGLAVGMDATCSGYQHYSALLLDPVGAGWVNLYDNGTDKKSDIYTSVLDRLNAALMEELRGPNRLMAEQWLGLGLTRDFSKSPTMTYVYGATARGMSEHATSYLLEKGWEVNGMSPFKMGHFIVEPLTRAIAETAPATAAGMAWVHRLIDRFDHNSGAPLTWRTPVGARILQTYRKSVQKRVRVRLCGVQTNVVLQDLDEMRPKKMKAAAAPNFVHSLDASHLIRVTNRMAEEGHSIIAVHDSFATHPGSVSAMQRIIREEFVKMYTEHDPLRELRDANGVDIELPERGSFDLNKVLTSEWFFS